MKKIDIIKTKLTIDDLRGSINRIEDGKTIDYKGIIEYTLDFTPQGGFSPKDIRDRNRIQVILDKAKENIIQIEDADYTNLQEIVNNAKWGTRDKELQEFLDIFNVR